MSVKPYIEANGKKYEFEANRRIMLEFSKQLRDKEADGVGLEIIENICFLMLASKYGISREEFDGILDAYCEQAGNYTEIYELLGAVVEKFFTPAASNNPPKNKFLAECRAEKATETGRTVSE